MLNTQNKKKCKISKMIETQHVCLLKRWQSATYKQLTIFPVYCFLKTKTVRQLHSGRACNERA